MQKKKKEGESIFVTGLQSMGATLSLMDHTFWSEFLQENFNHQQINRGVVNDQNDWFRCDFGGARHGVYRLLGNRLAAAMHLRGNFWLRDYRVGGLKAPSDVKNRKDMWNFAFFY